MHFLNLMIRSDSNNFDKQAGVRLIGCVGDVGVVKLWSTTLLPYIFITMSDNDKSKR